MLTGNLSHQIEHHLFPDLPARRYPQVAPEVRDAVRALRPGVQHRSPAAAARSVAKKIFRLALPDAPNPSTDRERAGEHAAAA